MSHDNGRLKTICEQSLSKKKLDTAENRQRLEQELDEIAKKRDAAYFLEHYDARKKFSTNENNLVVAYLLDLVDNVVWEKGPGYTVPEWP